VTSLLDSTHGSVWAPRMTSNLYTRGESALERRRQRAFRIQAWLGAATFLIANFALQQWGDLKGQARGGSSGRSCHSSPWRGSLP